ncbi:MAG TPA: alpha/beta fold hydrolase [Turneriella sp.]|nr:alpha/beta fold hydrolase [Turneriella sp.]
MKSDYISVPVSYGKINMQVAGPESDTAILFIHGWPDSHDTWSHQMEYFSAKYRVGAMDLPGVGGSDAPAERSGYHIDNILPVVSAAVKALKAPDARTPSVAASGQDHRGPRKVHLVAHDWGAIISWVFASRPEYASQIASYTAVSGPHPALARENLFDKFRSLNPGKMLEGVQQTAKSWYIYLFQLPHVPDFIFNNFGRLVWPRALMQGGVPEGDPLLDASQEEISRNVVNPLNLYREMLQGEWIEVPSRIDIPVQVIIPNHDLAITPEIYSNVTDVAPQAQLNYVDANHWVQRSHPQLVNGLIEKFIS